MGQNYLYLYFLWSCRDYIFSSHYHHPYLMADYYSYPATSAVIQSSKYINSSRELVSSSVVLPPATDEHDGAPAHDGTKVNSATGPGYNPYTSPFIIPLQTQGSRVSGIHYSYGNSPLPEDYVAHNCMYKHPGVPICQSPPFVYNYYPPPPVAYYYPPSMATSIKVRIIYQLDFYFSPDMLDSYQMYKYNAKTHTIKLVHLCKAITIPSLSKKLLLLFVREVIEEVPNLEMVDDHLVRIKSWPIAIARES